MGRFRFWVVATLLVVVGALLRLFAGSDAASQVGVTVMAANRSVNDSEGQPTPAEQAVLDLFTAFDAGRFSDAFDQAIEIQWEWREDRTLVATGLKDRDRFIADSVQELGKRGGSIAIFEITVAEADSVPMNHGAPELDALRSLSTAPPITQLVWARVAGTVKIACALGSWENLMCVIETGRRWRVLLPPPDVAERSRMRGLFQQKGEIVYVR